MVAAIDRTTLRAMMDRGDDFALIDTLPESAYRKGHLPGAIHIVSDDVTEEAPRRLPDRSAPIVVYCGSRECKRSEKAAARLEALGYTDVYDYVEGKRDWREAGLPLVEGETPGESGLR